MKDLVIQNEQGEIIDSCELWIQDLTHLILTNLSEEYLTKTSCLQFIDPYSNTVFNSLQMETLITELGELRRVCSLITDQEKVAAIIEFLRHYGHMHTSVKFLGD